MQPVELGPDVLRSIVRLVDRDHRWVAALIGRAMRDAVRATGRVRTSPAGALTSLRRYELALRHGCPWDERFFGQEIDRRTIGSNLRLMTRMSALAAGSSGALLRRLHADGCVWDALTCAAAAKSGDLATLQWARQHGCRGDPLTPRVAAQHGHLHVLQWACGHGWTADEDVFAGAALGGHMPVLEWLHGVACPWDASTCTSAAVAGRLDVLKWARERGCAWSDYTCAAAALGGHLEMLQWLHAGGCPWTSAVTTNAARAGHLAVLEWARSHGCDCDPKLVLCALAHPEIVRWLIANVPRPFGWFISASDLGLEASGRCPASAQTLQDLSDARLLSFKF
jgi:hypothetical protein